ncbi:MAG: hypothetical protein S0880_01270 [Actinomycetota bacterium]|nr:hypothetical protein [Actinomycetota bacterium]
MLAATLPLCMLAVAAHLSVGVVRELIDNRPVRGDQGWQPTWPIEPQDRPPAAQGIGPPLRLLDDAEVLDAPLVAASTTDTDSLTSHDETTMWVIADGRIAATPTLPYFITSASAHDPQRPFVFTEGRVVLIGRDAVEVVNASTGAVDARLESSRWPLLAGTGPGEVWAVHDEDDDATVTRITFEDGGPVETATLPLPPGEVWRGAARGLLMPGRLWMPDGSVDTPAIGGDRNAVTAASGPLVAVAGPGRRTLRIVDAPTNTNLGVADLDDEVGLSCFSSDRRRLALTHRGDLRFGLGPSLADHVTIVDVADPAGDAVEIDVGMPVFDLTWTSPTQLVVSVPFHLLAIDVTTGEVRPVAETGWIYAVTAEDSGC